MTRRTGAYSPWFCYHGRMIFPREGYKFLLLHLILSVAAFFLLVKFVPVIPTVWDYLVAPSASAFVIMLLDKLSAQTGSRRIPEMALYAIGLLGGSLGILAGMQAFRHKTRKGSFQFALALVCLIQIAAILFILKK